MRQRREFSRGFKLSILNELNVKKAVQVCREHNLHPVMICKWNE